MGFNEGERYGSMFGHSKISVVKSNKNNFVSCRELLIIMRWHSLKNIFLPVFFLLKLFSCFDCTHMGHLMLKFQATIAMLLLTKKITGY